MRSMVLVAMTAIAVIVCPLFSRGAVQLPHTVADGEQTTALTTARAPTETGPAMDSREGLGLPALPVVELMAEAAGSTSSRNEDSRSGYRDRDQDVSYPFPMFRARLDFRNGSFPHFVATGDVDGDGHLDLAVANANSDDVSILLGNGDGSFQAAISYSAGDYSVSGTHSEEPALCGGGPAAGT